MLPLALLATLVMGLPHLAAQDKKKKADDPPAAPVDADKLTPGDYTGKLLTTPGSDGTFTLQLEYKHYEAKNGGKLPKNATPQQQRLHQAQQKISHLQSQIAHSKNPREYTQHLNQLQQEMAHFQQLVAQQGGKLPADYKEVIDTKDVEMKMADNADVRLLNLPTEFDDMGKVKKYTEKELQEKKGKKRNLPGYEAKVDDLKANQKVKVTLARVYPKPAPKETTKPDEAKPEDAKKDDPKKEEPKKEEAKPADAKKDEAKPADAKPDLPKADDPKPPPEKKLQVTVIVIVEEAPDAPDPKKKPKKKNEE